MFTLVCKVPEELNNLNTLEILENDDRLLERILQAPIIGNRKKKKSRELTFLER